MESWNRGVNPVIPLDSSKNGKLYLRKRGFFILKTKAVALAKHLPTGVHGLTSWNSIPMT
jgi:hypothetical protein